MRGESRHAPSRHVPGRRDRSGAGPRPQRGVARQGYELPEAADLVSVLEPLIRRAGMDLESVRVSMAGRRRLLRIVVDSDSGVGLDEIADISRDVSARLDATAAMGEAPYTLEVSSPGVDRPLTEPRHWRRARGRLVAVSQAARNSQKPSPQTDAPGPAPALQGRVIVADDNGVTLEVGGRHRVFAYSELGPGRVQVEFARPGEDSQKDGGPVTAGAGSGDGGSPDGH
jgi:ribosome maturation factor RimP